MRGVDAKLEFVAIRLEVDFKLQFKLARQVCVDVWRRSGDIGNTTVIPGNISSVVIGREDIEAIYIRADVKLTNGEAQL
jgi:hypothetical protein